MAKTKIRATPEARTYIQRRGGKLFMWFQPARRGGDLGFFKVSTRAPQGRDVDFAAIDAGGFELLFDSVLARPKEIHIELRRLPWRRLQVTGVGDRVSADGDPGPEVHWWLGRGDGGAGGNGGGNGGG